MGSARVRFLAWFVVLFGCDLARGVIAPGEARAADRAAVGATHATIKIRPGTPVPRGRTVELLAARNEFEPFQIALNGGARGIRDVRARATALTGPAGAVIPASHVRLYREALYEVNFRSNVEGARGAWPDALVPDVDAYDGERRKAFPLDVPARETRAIWADVFVPRDARPGRYEGSVHVTAGDRPLATIAVRLDVRAFELPSVPTLKSAFSFSVDAACRAHRGTRYCDGNAEAEPFVKKYARAAMDHRITVMNPYYAMPSDGAWAHFDRVAAPLLDGTTASPLAGARATTFRSGYRRDEDPAWARARIAEARAHFAARGWEHVLFDYLYDEPQSCVAEVKQRSRLAREAGVRRLVTTDIDRIEECGWHDDIDIACPVVNQMHRKEKGDLARSERTRYDAFLARPGRELWWYQSCMSHGCQPEGSCDVRQERDEAAGYPSYAIDASAIQARAMEWLSFIYDVSGELYFDTVSQLDTAWKPSGLCDFGGHGDGTLFYPGVPSVIGGTTHIPVESIRLKMIREGMEDYEYLHLLARLGDAPLALREARRVFPAAYEVTRSAPEALYEARRRIADRIEELLRATAHGPR